MEKQLKKFSRKDLLEILVSQSKEIERLQEELALVRQQLDRRELAIQNAGSLAEAALHLNHIFRDADAAAQQYLDSIKAMAQRESAPREDRGAPQEKGHSQAELPAAAGRAPDHEA